MEQQYRVNVLKELNFRSSPEVKQDNVIGSLSKNQLVHKIEVDDSLFWWKISTDVSGEKVEGFVANKYLVPINPIIQGSLPLSGSVGRGGDNKPEDVLAVTTRLADLGFPVTRNSKIGDDTIPIIELFQSIIAGHVRFTDRNQPDGVIDVAQRTQKALESENVPRWMEMPKGSETEGFINIDELQNDKHDYGTNWMVETISAAAHLYQESYRGSNPGAALIQTNNLSRFLGGNAYPPHKTHQTGLSCDIRVPRKDGKVLGTNIDSSNYDQDAMRAILKAIRNQDKYGIQLIYFNDFSLITEGLCRNAPGHRNHAHIDIAPPKLG